MSETWPLLAVSDVAQPDGVAGGPFGSELVRSDYTSFGVPVIRGSNLSTGEYRFRVDELVFVSESKADELARNCALPGDIVVTQRGTLGQVGIVPNGHFPRWVISQSQMRLRCDRQKVVPLFVYYWLLSPETRAYIEANAVAAGVPHINLGFFRRMRLRLPPVSEQRAIAAVLGALDDKIDLNRRMSDTLEETARALFKSWFVDFDPVRAKVEGRQPFGMDTTMAALFPDAFEGSELGDVPRGWKPGSVGDIATFHDAKRVPLSSREREGRKGRFPYYGAAGLVDRIDGYLFDGVYVLVGEDGSVVNDDGAPVTQYVWGKFWVNNHAHVVTGTPGVPLEWLLLRLRSLDVRPFVTGAVQPKLSQGRLRECRAVVPPAASLQTFAHICEPLFERVRHVTDESAMLATLRDYLLPKLLSGEVRVRDAEKVVEAAT